ncbi:hypothetical protein ISP15_12775 [Dyella jejuensis]|uniref:Uncharacterized protein n=1 Tax=Dyella jejuensis TaxID=1432009 RepID=A0ABW8JJE8_9GAMM
MAGRPVGSLGYQADASRLRASTPSLHALRKKIAVGADRLLPDLFHRFETAVSSTTRR